MAFRTALKNEIILFDGAMGTLLQAAGLAPGESPVFWNITHPHEVQAIHSTYLEAGARVLTANTFGANRLKLKNSPYSVEAIVRAGIGHARKAIVDHEAATAQKDAHFVALDLSPLGQLLQPLGQLSFDQAYDLFKEQVVAGVAAGVDLILIETMIDTYELKAAVLAAQEASGLPVVATVAINEQGRLLNGADGACVCALLEGLGVDVLGFNCGAGPLEVAPYIKTLATYASTPLMLSPNAGLPKASAQVEEYSASPHEFAEQMAPLIQEYLTIAGGCCGTTPAHIRALQEVCNDLMPTPPQKKQRRSVSSYASSIDLAASQPVIDRRIDVRHDPALREALMRGELEYALDRAFDAVDDDAQIISIGTAHAELDERSILPELVELLQESLNRPLCLESADKGALERAVRIYNGCPLVDLRHFSGNVYTEMTALAQRYGAVVL